MRIDELADDGKAQTVAGAVGGEERLPYRLQMLWRDALAIVFHRQKDGARLRASPHDHPASTLARTDGVGDEVDHHLVDLVRIRLKWGGNRFDTKGDGMLARVLLQRGDNRCHDLAEVGVGQHRRRGTAEDQKVVDQPGQSLDLGVKHLDHLAVARRPGCALKHLGAGFENREGRPQLVGQTLGEYAHRRQRLRAGEVGPGTLKPIDHAAHGLGQDSNLRRRPGRDRWERLRLHRVELAGSSRQAAQAGGGRLHHEEHGGQGQHQEDHSQADQLPARRVDLGDDLRSGTGYTNFERPRDGVDRLRTPEIGLIGFREGLGPHEIGTVPIHQCGRGQLRRQSVVQEGAQRRPGDDSPQRGTVHEAHDVGAGHDDPAGRCHGECRPGLVRPKRLGHELGEDPEGRLLEAIRIGRGKQRTADPAGDGLRAVVQGRRQITQRERHPLVEVVHSEILRGLEVGPQGDEAMPLGKRLAKAVRGNAGPLIQVTVGIVCLAGFSDAIFPSDHGRCGHDDEEGEQEGETASERTEPVQVHRCFRRLILAAFAAVALALGASPARAQLPAPPVAGTDRFRVGGYASVTVGRPEHPESAEGLEVSELVAALIAWGRVSTRISYLVELDMAKRTSKTWTGREADEWVVPERLYLEYSASQLVRLRAGRFLTPIGLWNEQHAEPLTWTPTRPLTTYLPFANSLDGILLAGERGVAGRELGYSAYWAPRLDFDGHDSEQSSFIQAFGGRVAMEARSGLTFGLAAARVRRSRPADPDDNDGSAAMTDLDRREEDASPRTLLGADLRWATARFEVMSEGNLITATAEEPSEGGVYGMVSARLAGPLWAVTRGEVYRPVDGTTARMLYVGMTLRADRRLVVKFGRQFVQRASVRIPDGWFLSFSSLF